MLDRPEPEPRRRRAAGHTPEVRDVAPADPLLLFETERGRVRRCDCCDTLRIHLGSALLAVDTEGFGELTASVSAFDRGETPLGPWPVGHALLHVGETGAAFAFTPAEIAELHRLLAGTQLMLDLGFGYSPDA